MQGMDQFFQTDNDAGINQGGFASRGDLILNPSYNASYYGPAYDGKDNIIRILPYFDKTKPEMPEVPYRGGTGFTRFSPWYRSYPAFRSIGSNSKITILVNDPLKNPNFDQSSNPICVFVNEIKEAIAFAKKNRGFLPGGRTVAGSTLLPPHWYGLLEGSAGKGADIPMLSSVVLVTALIYNHSSKKDGMDGLPIGLRPDDGCIVFELTGPLWTKKVAPQLNALKPGYQATQGQVDFEEMYVNGDPVSLRNGRFLHIFKEGCDPRSGAFVGQASASSMYSQPNQTQGQSGGQFIAKGYDCFFSKTLPGYPTDTGMSATLSYSEPDLQWIEKTVRDRWVPLDELITVHSPARQAEYLMNVFSADMLMYAWERYPHWITPELRSRAAAVTNAAPPAPSVTSPSINTPGYGTGPGNFAPAIGDKGVMPTSTAPYNPTQTMLNWSAPSQTMTAQQQVAAAATAPTVPTPNFKAAPDSAAAGVNPSADFGRQYMPPSQPVPNGSAPPANPAVLPQPTGLSNIDHLKQLAGEIK